MTEFAWSGAFLVGAPLTGWLIANQGWPAPFLWLGVGGLAAAIFLWRVLPPAGKPRAARWARPIRGKPCANIRSSGPPRST